MEHTTLRPSAAEGGSAGLEPDVAPHCVYLLCVNDRTLLSLPEADVANARSEEQDDGAD